MKFGVQYYPYHWPEKQWATDAANMRQAGVKYVRMGDLGWSAYERKQGQLEFEWMDRAIDLFGAVGIKTVMCTCSRTPPPWLYRTKPGMLPVDREGVTRHSDGRYAVAMAHLEFSEEALRIDESVIRHFSGNEDIIAWQIDNEIGCHTDCYCDHCLSEFHLYLERKYKTPQALNEAWGTDFWAFSIGQFDEVPRPVEHPHIQLEYRRFLSSLNKEFAISRAKMIRALDPGKPVTTNFQNLYWDHTDYHNMSEVLDVNGMNHYPARTPELALDYYRGGRGEVWILEQQTHLPDMDSPPGWMRLRAWMAIGRGASALFFFRWRQCLYGCEQFGDGILPHDGRENRFLQEFAKIGGELDRLSELIEPTRPQSEIAIAYSYDSRWAIKASPYPDEVDPVMEAIDIHKAASKIAHSLDALDPRSDLSGYKLVVAPRMWLIDEAIEKNLRSFVMAGGCLCLTAGSGIVDEYGKCFTESRPGRLNDLAGIRVSDFTCDSDLEFSLRSETDPVLSGIRGNAIVDEIHMEEAEMIATHDVGWRKGSPAITRNRVGKGQVIYIGIRPDLKSWTPMLQFLANEAGIQCQPEQSQGVSSYERVCEDYRLKIVLNWNSEKRMVEIGTGWRDVFSGQVADGNVEIGPADIGIYKQ